MDVRLVLLITTGKGLFACRLWALSDSSRVKTERKKKERESRGVAEMMMSDMFWERTRRRKFQSGRGGVFSGFWAKRVTCRARDSVSIHLDGTNWRMGPKNKQLVVWEAGLQALVIRGAIRRTGGSLGGFFVFNHYYYFKKTQIKEKKRKKKTDVSAIGWVMLCFITENIGNWVVRNWISYFEYYMVFTEH